MSESRGAPRGDGLAVGISVYRPDEAMLRALLGTVVAYGGPVIVHVDGQTGEAIEPDLLAALQGDPRFVILQASQNGGIGAALNRLATEAERQGCEAILFFDQDSAPASTTALRLGDAFADLEARGLRPAVIGPAPTLDPHGPTKVPRYRDRPVAQAPSPCRATDYVITSGSLIDLAVLREIGAFEARYRMDAIDVEWCFRAWAKGYSVWYLPAVAMPHRVGTGIVSLGGLRFPRQSASRMGTYARNQFHLLRLGHIPLRWKLRTLVYVPLQLVAFVAKAPDRRWHLAGQLLCSLFDGLAARFEPRR